MDRLEAMSIVLRVVEKGSFSSASRALRMPLATVSRKVKELESHLGTQLLVRTTRKLALTDAGVAYVASARRILEEVDDAERIIAGELNAPRGELTLSAPVLFGRLVILPVVVDFLAAYPDISVRLLLTDSNLHLIDDRVDLVARIGRLPDSGMVAKRIGSMRTVVCASPGLLARFDAPESPEDLAALPCIDFDVLSPAATWAFRLKGARGTTDVPIKARLSVSTAEAAVWAARHGAGLTRVLHYQCADALQDGSLQTLLEEFEPEPLPVNLVYAGRGTVSSRLRAFLDFAVGRLRERLAFA